LKLNYFYFLGLFYDVTLSKGGLELTFQGYDHKLPVLVSKTLEELRKLAGPSIIVEQDIIQKSSSIDFNLFKRLKEKVLENYKNYLFWQPYYHCIYGSLVCLEDPRYFFLYIMIF
jgi:secreted Zn-dependent insulinase-like peptidase